MEASENMTKIISKLLLVFISAITFAHAEPVKIAGNIAVHIGHRHYIHPVRLLHPYLDIWHMKGPAAEKAALSTLSQRFANTTNCSTTEKADVVLLLEPHIFYNPQLRVFHAEFIARAYQNDGKPITTIKQQTDYLGYVNISADHYAEKAYQQAMRKIVKKLEVDSAFLSSLDKGKLISTKSLCTSLDDLPLSKIYY